MKQIFIFLFILAPSVLFAQSDYYEGNVVKSNGDTVKGFMEYHEWIYSPKSINFKINKNDHDILSFNPNTIRSFQLNGLETYIAYTGIVSMDQNAFPNLATQLDTSKKLDTIFLKKIQTGKYLTLYAQNDYTKARYFVAEANMPPVELIYHEYNNLAEGDNRIVSSFTFRGQFVLYINKYHPGDNKLINYASGMLFNIAELEKIINKINGTVNAEAQSITTLRPFFGIGVNTTTTQVGQPDFINVVKTYNTTAPKINLGVDLFVNPRVQRLIIRAEASYSYASPHYVFDGHTGVAPQNEYFSFRQNTLSITPQLLYNFFNTRKLKVYVDAGVSVNYSTYSDNKYSIQLPDGSFATLYYKLDPLWTSIPVQAGVTLNNKIEIYFTYIGYASFTSNVGGSPTYINNKSMCFGVKYLLGRH